MPEKPKLTLGKQLMDFIDENGLVDNRVPVPPGSIAHDEGRTSGWRKDAEADINEFVRVYLEGKISDLSIVDGILQTREENADV